MTDRRGFQRQSRTAAAAGQKEGSVYAYPSLAVLRKEGKDSTAVAVFRDEREQ